MREAYGGYYYYNIYIRILIFFAFSAPNIIDTVLSIIAYDNDLLKYYILRYITQVLCCIYSIMVINYITYEPYVHPKMGHFEEIYILMFLCLGLFILIPMEIACLVFFVKDYDSIESKGKIGYYIHLVTLPLSIILMISLKCRC